MNTNVRLEELESLLLAPLCSLLGEVQRLLDMTVVEHQTAEQEEQDGTVARGTGTATLSQQAAPPLATASGTANSVGLPADSYAVSLATSPADRSVHASYVSAANREQAPETQAVLSLATPQRESSVSAGQPVELETEPPPAFRAAVQPRRPSITLTDIPEQAGVQNLQQMTPTGNGNDSMRKPRTPSVSAVSGRQAFSLATPQSESSVSVSQPVEPETEPPPAFRAAVQPRRPSITPANAKTKLESHPVITLAPVPSSGSAGSSEPVVKSASQSEQASPPAENRALHYSSPYPVSAPAMSDHGASSIPPAPHRPPQTVNPWSDRPEPFSGSAYPPISRLPGIPLVSSALQQTAGRMLTGLEPTLERAYQLSQSALNSAPPQPERITPSGPVNNTFNVSITMTPQQAVTALDQEALQDALVEMLRAAARRHGLEL